MRRRASVLIAALVVPLALVLVVRRDARAGDFKEAQKQWKDALKKADVPALAAAAGELASSGDPKAVELLTDGAAKVPDARVYEAVVDGLATLARAGGEAAAEVRKAARKASDPRERMAVIDALTRAPDAEESVATVVACLEDKVQAVRVAAIRALGTMERKEGVDGLITRLEEGEKDGGGQEVEEARRALTKITGAEFSTAQDWKNFWEPRKGEFDPTSKSTEKGATVERGPKFFGSEVLSKRILLVLDVSNSMRVIDPKAPGEEAGGGTVPGGLPPGGAPPGGPGRDPGIGWPPDPQSRFARARDELIRFIAALEKDVAFNVIVFADDVKIWTEGALVPAQKPAKQKAVEWVNGIQWGPATRTDLAVEKAFEVKNADTVYLLSDGNPEKPGNVPIPQDEILKKVAELNRFRRLALHTMGFPGPHRAFLEKLAQENGGTYKDIR